MPKPIDAQTLKAMAGNLRDPAITDARASQLALDVARVNNAARAEGARNDFNAQPSDFAVALAALAKK
jgi:hypothetical protein